MHEGDCGTGPFRGSFDEAVIKGSRWGARCGGELRNWDKSKDALIKVAQYGSKGLLCSLSEAGSHRGHSRSLFTHDNVHHHAYLRRDSGVREEAACSFKLDVHVT